MVRLTDGEFSVAIDKISGWFHLLLNYIGPNNGQGIRIYYDGVEVGSADTKKRKTSTGGNGRIAIGRLYYDLDDVYDSVQVDELLFFNEALTEAEIKLLSKCTKYVTNVSWSCAL